MPVYREHDIPLMLPASTACELNTGGSFRPFRYQKNNAELIEYSVANCLKGGKEGKVYAICRTIPMQTVCWSISRLLSDVTVIRNIPARTARDDTYMIIGYSDFAAETVKRLSQAQLYRIVLLDDADSPEAYASCIIRPARFSRFVLCLIFTNTEEVSPTGMKPCWRCHLRHYRLTGAAQARSSAPGL